MDGKTVTYGNGELSGDQQIISAVSAVVEEGVRCDCDFWGAETASLSSDWSAYLTVCATIRWMTGFEPIVDRVPDNPDGYQPEGPVIEQTTTVASGHFIGVED
jgi:hypothetical protein